MSTACVVLRDRARDVVRRFQSRHVIGTVALAASGSASTGTCEPSAASALATVGCSDADEDNDVGDAAGVPADGTVKPAPRPVVASGLDDRDDTANEVATVVADSPARGRP